MKDRAIILARGGTGRELVSWLSDDYEILGFLDDRISAEDILGPISKWHEFKEDVKIFSALGNYRFMQARARILSDIPEQRFPSAISKSAICYQPKSSPGLLVFPGSVISVDTTFGKHVLIYHNVVVSHDSKISDYSIVSNGVTISGNCTIGCNCYVGAGSTILENVIIGNNCIVAAGATVIHNIPDGCIYIAPGKLKPNHYNS